jgi:hypothetical protein
LAAEVRFLQAFQDAKQNRRSVRDRRFDLQGKEITMMDSAGPQLLYNVGGIIGPATTVFPIAREMGTRPRILEGLHPTPETVDEGAVRFGHQVVDSGSAWTVSWVMETLPLPASAT